MNTEFKAIKPKFPGSFKLKDLAVYSTRLRPRDVKKYDELKPILMAEGRRPPPTKKTRGIQAGEDEFSDDEEYKTLGKLDLEFRMVIHDWAKTPIYHILTREMDVLKALMRYCNKTTLNRLAGDLRELREFEERTELRARRQHVQNRQKNPFLARDSDSDSNDDAKSVDKIAKLKELREMGREERISEVIANNLTETEVEYLIGNLRKNKTKRTIDDLSKIYLQAKHTFHILMCQLGQMQTYEHIMGIYGDHVDEDNLKETTMKLLIRCTYGFDSIERCRVIFKMYKRHEKLYEMLNVDEKLEEARILKKRLN